MSGPVEYAMKACVKLLSETVNVQRGCLTLYSAFVTYLLKRYTTDDNIEAVNADIETLKAQCLTALDYAQKLWTNTLKCESVFIENMLKVLFVEGANKLI